MAKPRAARRVTTASVLDCGCPAIPHVCGMQRVKSDFGKWFAKLEMRICEDGKAIL